MYSQHTGQSDLNLWRQFLSGNRPEELIHLGMTHAANCLSDLVHRPIQLLDLRIEEVPLDELCPSPDDPEGETVGVYLLSGDVLPGHAVLMCSVSDAMYLADWLLEERPGTTTRLDQLEYSALAESGNVALSAFLNTLAEFTDTPLRPSPPAITVDMLATILEAVAASTDLAANKLLIIKADFENTDTSLQIRFWLLPVLPGQAR